jgi:hypothetical protein
VAAYKLQLRTILQQAPSRVSSKPGHTDNKDATYKIGSIHDSIFHRMSAVQGELQNLLLFFAPLRHKLFLRKHTNNKK